uniref:fibronectin type III domain-containing protein n=1 Tax=Candidatus Planktophila sp. TaxID=2175601 RepID=UPI00404AF196
MRADCNPRIHRTALWQRPLGPPLAPSINSVVMGVLGSATLNITAPIEDGGSKVTSYLLTSTPGQIEAIYTPAQIKEAKVIGLSPGSTYSFSVVAINEQGPSVSSIASSPALAPTTPGAPSITKVTATGTNSAQLSFTAPLDDGGSPITSYVATSSPGGLKTTLHQSTGGTINITNLSHSTTYTFTLTANNAAGPSLSSAISTSITTETPPPPPEPVAVAPPAPTNTVISVAAIAGVTAPVTGATPVSTTTAGTGYTGSVSWSGSPATFAGATIYTATITLTATSGYTLTGVNENFFTVAG